MEKLYQEWQHQKSKMLLRVFNSCAAKGTTSISESIFAFVNASKVCKISRDLLKIVSQAIKNQVWKHWREIRIPAYTDGKPVTCSSPPQNERKNSSAQKFEATQMYASEGVWSWQNLLMKKCIWNFAGGKGKDSGEDQFRANKTQSIWKCLCKIFQKINTMKISLKEVTKNLFYYWRVLLGLQNKKSKSLI